MQKRVAQFAETFKPGQWSFLGPANGEGGQTTWIMELHSRENDAIIR